MKNKHATATSNSSERVESRHKMLYSTSIAVALCLVWLGTSSLTPLQSTGANFARLASYVVLALYVAWMFALIWMRDSKSRWLSLAILVEWVGVAMLYLPSVEIRLPNGMCTHVLEVGKSFELAGLFFGLTATIWLASGAWLTAADVRGLDHIAKQEKWKRFVGSLLKSAHKQITLGLFTAIVAGTLTACSAGWELYSKLNGVELPKEQKCSPMAATS